jgi:peptidoglycan/xylan/chitin deacetylase (PgdA/CDA1 family)
MGAQAPRQVGRISGTLMAAAAAALVSCASLPPNSTTIPPASTATSSPVPSDTPTPIPTPTESPSPTPTPQLALGQTSHRPPLPSGAGELVPILYMHRVVPIPADIGTWTSDAQRAFLPYMITPCEFSAQLDWLAANGYTTILPRDLVAHWDQGVALPPKPVILTFDDGSADWAATVLPLLASHAMVAEFYVTTSGIGSWLSWADLAALRDGGNGIGAHDVHHVQLVGSTTQTLGAMRYEVTEAKRLLEANLGIQVDSMAYVGGGYNSALIDLVRRAGYRSARSIVRGDLQSTDIRFHLHVSRIGVYDDVIGKTLANAMGCVLDPAMSDFQARVTGTNPG